MMDSMARAKEVTGEILRLMGVEATIETKEEGENIAMAIAPGKGGEEVGLREGHRSAVLEALQVVVNRAVNRANEPRKFITLDVGDFRESTDPELMAMAKRLAEKVLAIGKPVAVGPMNARDRRQVHLALAGMPGIKTHSEGEGIARRLLIIPTDRSAPAASAPAKPEGQS
jgi:spoIIIJ-associated protein